MYAPACNTVDSIQLQVVDLAVDPDLPSAANPSNILGALSTEYGEGIAGGHAIKAAIGKGVNPIGPRGYPGKNQNQGFAIQSFGYQGLQVGDVLTFALNIATDATDTWSMPNYQLWLSSGWGGVTYGSDIRVVQANVNLAEGTTTVRPRVNLPLASEGWTRLSVNYSPAYTPEFFNLNGDNVMDSADLAILANVANAGEYGWNGADEMGVAYAGFQLRGVATQTVTTVHVWMDNLVVYRSAFELDLALGAEELNVAVTPGPKLSNLIGVAIGQTAGNLDGSIEGYSGSLDAVGIDLGYGGGGAPAFEYTKKNNINGASANVTVDSTHDHTNFNSTKCLKVILAGDDGPDGTSGNWSEILQGIDTAIVAGSGSGTYVFECYVAKDRTVNVSKNDRHPKVRCILQEVAPNWLGSANAITYNLGGLPDDVDTGIDIPYNWARTVCTMYIPGCENLVGRVNIMDTYQADVGLFNVPIYIDDLKLYRVDDPANVFDADLYDNS